MSAIFVNQIDKKYLMRKTKDDIASLTLWIIGNQERDKNETRDILAKILECLNSGNIEEAKATIERWNNWHKPWEPQP